VRHEAAGRANELGSAARWRKRADGGASVEESEPVGRDEVLSIWRAEERGGRTKRKSEEQERLAIRARRSRSDRLEQHSSAESCSTIHKL